MMSALLKAAMLRHLRVPAVQTVNLNGRNLSRSFISWMSPNVPDEHYEEEVICTATDIIKSTDPVNKSLQRACESIVAHPKVKFYPDSFGARVAWRVMNSMQNDPEIDQEKLFGHRPNILVFMASKENYSKDEILSSVLEIVKVTPLACPSKVTEDADFFKDLEMGSDHFNFLMLALGSKFKLMLPDEDIRKINSCKSASEYIHYHLSRRLPGKYGVETNYTLKHCLSEDEEVVMFVVNDILESNPDIKSPCEVLDILEETPKVVHASPSFRASVQWKLFESLLKDPNLDPLLAHTARVVVSLFSSDENVELTKGEVISKVFDVVKSYRKVCPSKVTEEANFSKDLGLDAEGYKNILCHLQYAFKLFIPHKDAFKINSVKSASEYIYDHLDQKIPRTQLVNKVGSINRDDDDLWWQLKKV